jgi:phosphoribosyl-ATP pyrophosphohydrolase
MTDSATTDETDSATTDETDSATTDETDSATTDRTDSSTAGETDSPTTDETLAELFATIEDRRENLPEDSYTASLFTHEKGENAVLEKLGEETTELILAAKDGDTAELRHESADIVYHLLVLLAMEGMTLDDLRAELRDRF